MQAKCTKTLKFSPNGTDLEIYRPGDKMEGDAAAFAVKNGFGEKIKAAPKTENKAKPKPANKSK